MEDFISGLSREAQVKYAKHNGGFSDCGTCACALGHGPSAGILFKRSEFVTPDKASWRSPAGAPDWFKYVERFIPEGTDVEGQNTKLFEWLFGGGWGEVDNHHYGAAARIRFVLDGNEFPLNFDSSAARPKDKRLYRAYDKRYGARA